MTVISPKFAAAARRLDREEAAARKAARKLRKEYEKARRHLLELVVWQNPQMSLGVMPRDVEVVPPQDFARELQARADDVTDAWDRYTDCTVTFDPDIPKL